MEIKGAAQLYLKNRVCPATENKKKTYIFYKRIKTTKLIVF